MTLNRFLLQNTNVGDLFIGSINPTLLIKEVKSYQYENIDWTIKPVLVVEI